MKVALVFSDRDAHLQIWNKKVQPLVYKVGDCWETSHCRFWNGYGMLQVGRKKLRLHRLSYTVHIGVIPNGGLVLHKCDNPACVNPEHLYLGTYKQNAIDREVRGRNAMTKLSYQDRVNIRNSKLKSTELAKQYDVHVNTILKYRRAQ